MDGRPLAAYLLLALLMLAIVYGLAWLIGYRHEELRRAQGRQPRRWRMGWWRRRRR